MMAKAVKWTPVEASEIPKLKYKNETRRCIEEFLKSGHQACKLDVSAYSGPLSLRQCFVREIKKFYNGKIALVKRGEEFYLLRRDI